jgi:hypothetical protein
MIDVEIHGPVAKKEYEKLRKLLQTAGEDVRAERRVSIFYKGADAGVLADLELRAGTRSELVLKDRRSDRQTSLILMPGQLSDALAFCASLGYFKGKVSVREFFAARYGGAQFNLIDPLEDESFHYEAFMTVHDPAGAKEAKKKLEVLARKFKLPLWTSAEMLTFRSALSERIDYEYDFNEHGAQHFREKFGI